MTSRLTRAERTERVRADLLVAARRTFLRRGFHQASLEEIALAAGWSKGAVFSNFAGKDELFLAVLEQSYVDIRAAEHALQLQATDPLQAIETLVAFTWDHYLRHPEFLALLNSENMLRAGHLKRSRRIRQMGSPLIELLADVLARGEASGVLRSAIDPMQLYISIAGLAYFYLSNKHTLGAIFGRDLMAADALAERLAHMTEVVVAYVRKPAPTRARKRPSGTSRSPIANANHRRTA